MSQQHSLTEYKVIDPSNGKHLKTFPTATDEQISAAIDKAHNAYTKVWKSTPVHERTKILRKVADLIRQNKKEMVEIAVTEMGKAIAQMEGEVDYICDILEYYAENAEGFLKSVPCPGVPGAEVVSESVGVILAIEPWNFPYYQVIRVVAPQLAAGNAALVKPANCVAESALYLEKLFLQAGAPAGVFQVILATIPQIETLIDDFRVRGVTLTGSERAGKAVAERAGRNLKKVVLELGGSDPFIVLEDADLDEAVQIAFDGRMDNMGQVCVALKRHIIVGRERGDKFKEAFVKLIKNMKIGDPRDRSTSVGPLFAEAGVVNILRQIEEAKAAGAKVVVGGKRIDRPGAYVEPTLITDISRENPLFLQETFGPVASLYVVDTEEEAIELANATPYGLGGAVASTNIEHAKKVAAQIETGMVFINSHMNATAATPFGGVKNSGFGRELADLGFNEFVNKKMIRVHEKYL
ncbi:aldehyde dehydrogenase family domain-containing protein [Trichoderma breve]|uniref:Aldehyde dehydrogenase family domain-containing protein n=1 Tax=Trichoderma breve TaxID=2034170 RepID=A0A9W9JS23_9HYPO|nr:aldehyde dehydrogenase family domain-containing protein [Trichoderma breve]KAJ4864002.1 aldehyde dehydrogenase family domain-containing protein [Trichoderma breve]